MKRKEEIMQEANTRYGVNHPFINIAKESFIEGAKWADKTILDNACEWLKKNIDLYAYDSSNTHYPEIKLTECFEEAFRQAMEGGADDVR